MNIKSLVILVLFLVVGVGVYYYSDAKQSVNVSDKIGVAILPGLKLSLNNVSQLQIVGPGNQILSTITRSDMGWSVQERNAYPADLSKVRATLLNLADAKIIEEKTSNADLYSKLGVEDVSSTDAQGTKAIIKYDNNTDELIVGKPGPQINKSRYVRPGNSDTSWLIDRKIDLKYQADYWLKKDILSIEPNEVASVTIVLPDGAELAIANNNDEENTFSVTNLTNPNSQVIDAELHQVTNALSAFQLLDVTTAEQFADKNPSMNVSYQLKSGAKIDLTAFDENSEHYASVDVSINIDQVGDNQSIQEYVGNLKKATSGWVFKIPNVSYDSMYKREADVLAITEDQLN